MNDGQFKKGMPRPLGAGRKKGTLNRKTEALVEKCERMGIDLFEALLDLAKSPDPTIRLSALREAIQYIYPKRKAVELTAEHDIRLLEKIKQMEDLPEETLRQIAGRSNE
jgi:hypothetical protein